MSKITNQSPSILNSKTYSTAKKVTKVSKRTPSNDSNINRNLQDAYSQNSGVKIARESGRSPGKIFNFDRTETWKIAKTSSQERKATQPYLKMYNQAPPLKVAELQAQAAATPAKTQRVP
jgi:hypothetical protein